MRPVVVPVVLSLVCLIAGASSAASTASAGEAPEVNAQAAALKEFTDRTRAYMELRERLAATAPPLSNDSTPEEIEIHQEELRKAIRQARPGNRQGELFAPAVVPLFRSIIRRDLRSRSTRDAIAAMQDVPSTLALRVHTQWPPNAARATVPGRLLKNLPPLPEGLEYRFIGRHLVIVDIGADLIVDYVMNVVPASIRRR